jgi:hypothetical protein
VANWFDYLVNWAYIGTSSAKQKIDSPEAGPLVVKIILEINAFFDTWI